MDIDQDQPDYNFARFSFQYLHIKFKFQQLALIHLYNQCYRWPIIIPNSLSKYFAVILRFFSMTNLTKSLLPVLCIFLVVSELSFHECK